MCEPPQYTAQEQQADYKKSYEFAHYKSVRSPVGGWEDKHIRSGEAYRVPQKEINLVKGTPHSFKGVRTGNSYSKREAICRAKPRNRKEY